MKLIFSILILFFSIQYSIGQTTKDSIYFKKIAGQGVKFIPVYNGKYKVFTQKVGKGKIKLLLLHGGPANTHEYFENFPENLKELGVEIYYYDQLGSHYSDQPNDTIVWDVNRFVEEVEEVRKGLDLTGFYLLGHSWGGMLAELYAAKYGSELKGLIISNSPALIRDTAKTNAVTRARRARIDLQTKALPEFIKVPSSTLDSISRRLRIADTVLYSSLLQAYSAKADSIEGRDYTYRGDVRPDPLFRNRLHVNRKQREESGIGLKMWQPDYPTAMEQIKCPVLIIGGVYDRMQQECYPDMKKQFVRTKVRIYLCPNGSHFSMWDDTENYFREVGRFLKDVENSRFDPDN